MTIYIVSGGARSGRSTFAERLVGRSNVYDLSAAMKAWPLEFPKRLQKLLDGRNRVEGRVAIDGVTDMQQVNLIKSLAKVGDDITHYHVRTGLGESSEDLLECGEQAEYLVYWMRRA